MTDRPILSCIIPAFNEAPRIGAVLDAVLGHPLICEVIVVDDGSSDGTADRAEARAAQAPGLRVIRQPRNGGKSRAVATGIEAARGTHILLLDSDLLGLDADHLSALIAPVLDARAEAAISLRRNAPLPWRMIGIDYISGERVMPRALLAGQTDTLRSLPRFGLEVFINRLWLNAGLRLAIVRWPGVESPFKHAKRGSRLAGLRADAAMLGDIFRTVPPMETLKQVLALRARRI
ncbi:glycosyltransferase family 2 protein [Salipiger sp. P9]|uniref:glycosyltransferase family 2 protein n=1 Tax=Salipiger pentaromativorans TaxID=2943193 RepID=UPI0021575365|nr:glycosyltransferase family 2 protein [Salipiger pentaromativorans]MCR8547835.1 glycosyltransferase family 2 protein [Salipiger pentaromativorans]